MGRSSLRVVFAQTRNFTVIGFTDENMYAISMAQRNGYKRRFWTEVSDPTPACVIVSAVRLSKALKHKHSKELTEFLYQAVDLPTSDVRFIQKTRAWSRSAMPNPQAACGPV